MKRLLYLVVCAPLLVLGCGDNDAGSPVPGNGAGDAPGGGTGEPLFGANGATQSGTGGGTTGGDPTDGDTSGSSTGATGGPTGGDKPPGDNVNPYDDIDPTCGQGTVYGIICSTADQFFVNDAEVWVDTVDCAENPIIRSTMSNANGYYTLEGVPSGMQTVLVKKDEFEKSYNVLVQDGKVTDVTAVGKKECFQVVDLCPTGAIDGTACHQDGSPLEAGFPVKATGMNCDDVIETVEAFTDADGKYFLPNLREGTWEITVAAGPVPLVYSVEVKDGVTVNLEELGIELCVQDEQCFEGLDNIPVESKVVSGMADIVLFIDTSGSMKEETKWVQDNVNAFTQYIAAQAVDFHVILVADGGKICVEPPLGGPNCGDSPNFRHVKQSVGSHDGLEKVIDAYPKYQDFLRAGATTNFIAVTDDNSKKDASWFKGKVSQQANPGFSNSWIFHSIVAYGDIPFIGCITGAFGGTVYLDLTTSTGGSKFPVCETNWGPIFDQMAASVVDSVSSACGYAIPSPEKVTGAESVSAKYVKGGQQTPIAKVADANGCGAGGGFYFDSNNNPTKVFLCASTCDSLFGGVIQLQYSCGDGK